MNVPSPSERIDQLIADTPDWRGDVFVRLRRLIREADPEATEEWKWVTANRPGTPLWEHAGMVCHINILKERVRLTMHEGADLPDPHRIFNASLEGNQRRGIDFYEGDPIDEPALRDLIRAGVERRLARAAAKEK
jgi:hypothetical protein